MAKEIFDKVNALLAEIQNAAPAGEAEVERFRIRFLGTKNVLKPLFGEIRNIPNERKREFGLLVNEVKQTAETRYGEFSRQSAAAAEAVEAAHLDLSAPGEPLRVGSRHPISSMMNCIVGIFGKMGFNVAEDQEIEDDWHNFTALGTPPNHPARDMQDTYYLLNDPDRLLRTHTSSVQVRMMERQSPPIRAVFPGRVYRNETISSRAHCQFHQVEGLYIAEDVSFADLKQTIEYFSKELFGADTKIRMRPSFFPFTEPSMEVDVTCFICGGEGCNVCKYTTWVEIGGCGMVDPKVLDNCGIDSEKYTGFAFGMGVERIAMLKYRIDDIRLLFENDVRFLEQFSASLI